LIYQVSLSSKRRTHLTLLGLGDLNQSRTAATNAIRRRAQIEIIVAKPERIATDQNVLQQIKQSIKTHGAKNTILVLTKIDVSDYYSKDGFS
jgi:aspartate carbamoyltransferase catalytic subunit